VWDLAHAVVGPQVWGSFAVSTAPASRNLVDDNLSAALRRSYYMVQITREDSACDSKALLLAAWHHREEFTEQEAMCNCLTTASGTIGNGIKEFVPWEVVRHREFEMCRLLKSR
jgi:hypothetical protein